MPSCVFRKCKNYGTKVKKDEGVTYHTFPSEELLRHKWVSKVRAERSEHDWMPTKSSTVCSAHFEDQHKYNTQKGYVRLKKCAVPDDFQDVVPRNSMPTRLEDKVPRASTLTSSLDDVVPRVSMPTSPEDVVPLVSMPTNLEDVVPRASTSTSLSGVNLSDMDSVCDTPRKATLKKQVRKLSLEKKVLQKKNKVLKNQNTRLNKKITSMKNIIVKMLKKEHYVSEQQF